MLNIKKHQLVMFNIINKIYQNNIGQYLGFKGGTMAYFFYGLDRFSVDLDFDLIDESKKNEVVKKITQILKEYGLIKDQSNKKFTFFWLLNYEKNNRNIKIEISKRNQQKITYILSNFYGTDVKIPKIEDAFATKLLACTTRNKIAYRDFYDVYFYLKKGVIPNENIIIKETNKNLIDYLIFLVNFIDKKITNKDILNSIGELIDENQKEFIRKKFKEDLINYLNFFIDSIKKSNK